MARQRGRRQCGCSSPSHETLNSLDRLLFAVCTSLVPLEAAAQADRAPADKTLSPYFFVEGGDPSIDRLPLKDTRVDVAIAGVIADVTVRQVYENRGTRPIHARYVFPASTRAAVYGMTMTVGDVRTVARIRERKQAAREFEAAKRDGKSASLLEQSRPNVFSMKVANVLPGDTISVELKYTELLVPTDGVYEFVYPTVVGPRYSEKRESQASPATSSSRLRTPARARRRAASSTSRAWCRPACRFRSSPRPRISWLSARPARGEPTMTLAESDRFSGNRDFILRYRLAGQEIASGLLLYQGRNENFFLLMAEPPQVVAAGRGAAARVHLRARRVGIDEWLSARHGEEADGRSRERASTLRHVQHRRVCRRLRDVLAVSVPATRPNLTRALQFIGQKEGRRWDAAAGRARAGGGHPASAARCRAASSW